MKISKGLRRLRLPLYTGILPKKVTLVPPSNPRVTAPMPSSPVRLEVLYEDRAVVAINKPAGMVTQGAGAAEGDSAAEQVKTYLKEKYAKPGNVFLGIVHRLDRPVSGVLLFARNSKAAARLSAQFREREVRKLYWAAVEQAPPGPQGELRDWLLKRSESTQAERVRPNTTGARECHLQYRVLARASVEWPQMSGRLLAGRDRTRDVNRRCRPALLEIEPATGRRHQIRAQLGHRGCAIIGDRRYGARSGLVAHDRRPGGEIALHARSIHFRHPISQEPVSVTAPLPRSWQALLQALGMSDVR